jgi:hypothetical protein
VTAFLGPVIEGGRTEEHAHRSRGVSLYEQTLRSLT